MGVSFDCKYSLGNLIATLLFTLNVVPIVFGEGSVEAAGSLVEEPPAELDGSLEVPAARSLVGTVAADDDEFSSDFISILAVVMVFELAVAEGSSNDSFLISNF